ncbi:MAG: DEAD/DEAH box helicase [Anaerolineae bacterium]|jgi:SNF2 family DNA or RNA helicase|nr:DEAD/DEAH box helicase [Anaerolineae bacterium]MBT5466675.1 DEAD/DEAH box helicase [Candidatus Neomarinimicrobiota bacterium]MBT4311608.1 DEAD/DEAH box helicase [Anaerolineae bacterium]MBT4457802.1 DEAD/DEAH box helicase [Anaerolineae bacterium]MBT4843493.1 DEAD/DEAH box helicase [Anaerolineae bacterium]
MNIIHAHYQPPQNADDPVGIYFWAETPDAPQPSPRRGRAAKTPKPKVHPFATAPTIKGEKRTLTLQLPEVRGIPTPSPQLIHNWDIPTAEKTLSPFNLDAIWVPAPDAVALLLAFSVPEPILDGTRLEPGLVTRFWSRVASLALEALSAQKLVPIIEGNDARWLPVLDSPRDAQRLSQLEAAMPPLCRAEFPEISSKNLLNSFLNTFCDSLARTWGKESAPRSDSEPASRWISALFNKNPAIQLSPKQIRLLKPSQRAWMRNLHVAGDETSRVAFRLEAPASEKDAWNLHYLIQAKDDPSLLIPAEEVWKKSKGALTRLGHRFEQPQEKLLTGLGYAARLFPPITKSLKSKIPTELSIDTQNAYSFLRETAPILEGAGFGILVPPWWKRQGARLGVKAKLKTSKDKVAKGMMTLQNLVSYQWQLSIGDTELTEEEFLALANIKSPLVQIRGEWVTLNAEDIEAAIAFWKKEQFEGELSLLEAMRLGLGGEEAVGGLKISAVETDGWLKELMEGFEQSEKLEELAQPIALAGELRPYQKYGYSWLAFLRKWGMGACLADDMGLGKTIQTIALLQREKELNGKLPAPALLIAPTSVVTNWEREIGKFAPNLESYVHRGATRLKSGAFRDAVKDKDVVLTSYPLARIDAKSLQSIQWLAVILDEAQNIKNPAAKQTQEIKKLESDFRIALTGTPVENRLSELWSIMQFLNPGYLGKQKVFREKFSLPIERYQDQEAVKQLRQLTTPFILRRVKTDPTVISDLPEKVETKVYCSLTEEQATLYEAVVQDALKSIEGEEGMQRKGLVLSMLMQLKQICNHPVQYLHQMDKKAGSVSLDDRSGKLERLGELLEEVLERDERALIFTQFTEMGDILTEHLPKSLGTATQFLHGGTPTKKRDEMVRRFQEDDSAPPVFILSLKAGGTGLNLTRANHVFHFDRWWNPAVENQATDRVFRIGQKQNVQVHKFVTTGTLEEMIDDMIESKKALADAVVGTGEKWLTEMSTDELRKAVSLRKF